MKDNNESFSKPFDRFLTRSENKTLTMEDKSIYNTKCCVLHEVVTWAESIMGWGTKESTWSTCCVSFSGLVLQVTFV